MYLKKSDVRRLRELRDLLTMRNARFEKWPGEEGNGSLPQSEQEVTDFIRKRTEHWRKSWVFPVLDDILNKATPTEPAS